MSVAQIRLSAEEGKQGPLGTFLLDGSMAEAVRTVAGWLGAEGRHDLPPLLQTAVARGSPDVYALDFGLHATHWTSKA